MRLGLTIVTALVWTVAAGCASGGKLAGAVPINIEAPDTATAADGAASNAGGWFNFQSIGGAGGVLALAIVVVVSFVWLVEKAGKALFGLISKWKCNYPPVCDHLPPKH